MTALRQSSLAAEGPLKVSKYLSIQLLVDTHEMQDLLSALPEFVVANGSSVSEPGQGCQAPEAFLEVYRGYISTLKAGEIPTAESYRSRFYDMWTVNTDLLYAIPVGEDKQVIKACKPVVQLQAHSIGYSPIDGKFRPMVLGADAIPWGIQISYPQVFQDPKTAEIHKVDASENFPNTQFFKEIQRWVRSHTIPTPFVVDGQRTNVPMRLGKDCLSWISGHPQLKAKGIGIEGAP